MKQRNYALLLCGLLIVVAGTVFAQPYKDSIRSQFQDYTNLIIKKDFQGSVRFVNSDLLKLVPATQLVAAMEQTMNNPEFEVKMGQVKILSIGDSQVLNKRYYVQLQYLSTLEMRMNKATDTARMKAGLASQFRKENVKYDAATQFYQVTMQKNVVADSNNAKSWKFVVIEDRQLPLLQKFIPAEVLDFGH